MAAAQPESSNKSIAMNATRVAPTAEGTRLFQGCKTASATVPAWSTTLHRRSLPPNATAERGINFLSTGYPGLCLGGADTFKTNTASHVPTTLTSDGAHKQDTVTTSFTQRMSSLLYRKSTSQRANEPTSKASYASRQLNKISITVNVTTLQSAHRDRNLSCLHLHRETASR